MDTYTLLSTVFMMSGGMMPTLEQASIIPPYWNNWITLEEWYTRLHPYIEMFFINYSDKYYIDQMNRARKIVERMEINGCNRLVMMDGHGRMTLCVLHAMQEPGIPFSKYRIVLVDVDDGVVEWHKRFMSCKIESYKMDVFSYRMNSETFLYLNFCALRECKIPLMAYLKRSPYKHNIAVSFTVEGMFHSSSARERYWKKKRCPLLGCLRDNGYGEECVRGFFKTYMYDPYSTGEEKRSQVKRVGMKAMKSVKSRKKRLSRMLDLSY